MILPILNQIGATTKRTKKEDILKGVGPNELPLLHKVLTLAYDNQIDFGLRAYTRSETHENNLSLEAALNALTNLSSRAATGNTAIALVESLDQKLGQDDAEVLYRVLQRDLAVGISASTINKVWPGLIYEHPYMRCSSFNKKNLKKIKFPCFSQTKADGLYIDIIVDNGVVEYRTRSGGYPDFSHQPNDESLLTGHGFVFQGEALLLDDEGNVQSRLTGNGRLNSDDYDKSKLIFVVWDIIPVLDYRRGECNVNYVHRLALLRKYLKLMNNPSIRLVDSKAVNSAEEIIEHFNENVGKGEEGTVIKNQNLKWKSHTSRDQIKVKIEFEVDLKVTGIKEGTGKYKGMLGALECATEDDLIQVSVGGGYSDKEREAYFTEEMIGKVIGVKANDITQNKSDTSKYSLFLPRHTKLRKDKTVADTYEMVVEQHAAFVYTLNAIGH